MSGWSRIGWLCAGAAAATSPGVARADDTADLQQLLDETVITTASKSAETGTTAPATSTTVTAEDLRRYGIHTLAEALDFLSLGVWTSSNLTTTDVGARGVILPQDQGRHFLLLIDGHAMNEPLFGAARFDRAAGIPMEMVDHIEVIVGPGSVLYGSNAMLGVVNVITKRAKDWKGIHAVGEWEPGRSSRAAAGVGWVMGDATELTLMLDYWEQTGPNLFVGHDSGHFDNLRLTPVRYRPDGADDGDWGGSATHTPRARVPAGLLRFVTGNLEIDVGANIAERSAPYDLASFGGNAFFDDPAAQQIDRHVWADAKYRATLSPVVGMVARAYADTYDYRRSDDTAYGAECFPFNPDTHFGVPECRLELSGASRWAGAEVQASFDWLRDSRLVTLVGVDARLRFVGSKTDTLDYDTFVTSGTREPVRSSYGVIDRTDTTVGAYVEETWRPVAWLGINGGYRLDVDPRFKPQASPRVAATVGAWTGGTFKAIYATAFRAPTFGESLYTNPNQIVSHDLRPETERSAEVSLEQRIVGAHKVHFGVFRSWWDDLIELHQLTQDEIAAAERAGELSVLNSNVVTQYRNVSSIQSVGFDGGVSGAGGDGALRYALSVTESRTTFDDPSSGLAAHPIAVAPSVFGNARVSYDLPGSWPTLALAARWLGRRPADRAFDGNLTPPPFVAPDVTLRAVVSGDVAPSTNWLRGLSYRASADWTRQDVAPYVVGPTQILGGQNPYQNGSGNYALAPVDAWRAMIGLQWDFNP